MRALLFSAILIAGFAPSAAARANEKVFAVCAAFARNGGSVTAVTHATSLAAEITDPDGTVSTLALSLSVATTDTEPSASLYSCSAYFDRDSDLIAIGVSYPSAEGYSLSKGYSLSIGVADAHQHKWIAKWTVDAESGIYQPLLLGFLEGTTSLIVGGEPSTRTNSDYGIHHGSFWSLEFSPQGKQLHSMPAIRDFGSLSDLFPLYADTSHNRLWLFRCVTVSAPDSGQPDCPVNWMTLVGDPSSSSEFDPRKPNGKRTDFWMSPTTFAAPDENTIVVAEGETVWLVDMQKQSLSRLTIPKHFHFPRFEGIYGEAAISPDGAVIALPLVDHAVAFPYLMDNYVYKGTNFAVVQLRPFQLLGILPGAGANSWASCAIDNVHGDIVALNFRRDHWERKELKTSPHP